MKQICIYIFLFVAFACNKEEISRETRNTEGVVVEKDYIWKTPLTDKAWVYHGGTNVPIYEGKFITATQFGEYPKLAAVDIFTGEIVWEWNDFIGNDVNQDFIRIKWPYVYENRMIFKEGPRTYCIDLDTGQTLWNDLGSQEFSLSGHITGYKDQYFFEGQSSEDTLDYIHWTSYIGSVYGPDFEEIPYAPYDFIAHDWERIANWYTGGKMFERDGKEYFVCTYQRVLDLYMLWSSLNLYNVTDQRWEYSQKELLPPHNRNNAVGFPQIENDIVVTAIGNHICANDLMTGDSLWTFDTKGNMVFGGFIVHDGCVYAQSEVQGLYCINLQTGEQKWKMWHYALGTTSQMAHLNGVIYFVNGGNGNLMAVDMETGELLWDIESPDRESFNREVEVYEGGPGEKNMVVTSTYQSALAYEAVR
jgi:outer membrane protein assembly factor BamB